ncbi:hypothetical protein Cgig2_021816 [Carnegiea gigantea]|uniref:DUF4283 domain-containing protein n=1 Tax=Carnegiea gigantea TaxID=171969 RepID=A0A9Q1GHW5_9CARY|nr:hypothetical protein Cgig2_021816 [Carnegiea gigantea]
MARGGRGGRPRNVIDTSPTLAPMPSQSSASPAVNSPTHSAAFAASALSDPGVSVAELNPNGTLSPLPNASPQQNQEIDYWRSAIICTVLGRNPPVEIMKGFLNRIWNAYEIDKILLVKKGVFLVRFVHLHDKNLVEKKGFYYSDNKRLLVRFPQLYWRTDSLSKIGSILSIPIKVDKYTKEKMGIRYARMLIEMAIDGPFPAFVEFFNKEDILIRQQLHYD